MRQFTAMADTLRKYEFPSPIAQTVTRFIKGGLRELYVGAEAIDQLNDSINANAASRIRNGVANRVIYKGGVIYVKDACVKKK
jgi:hypothetical protein